MAGKTFPGMGELEEQSADPADAADSGATPAPSGPFYSGPTVVDDVKVEEGLQKLRALDAPPAVVGAIDTAAEIVESGGHAIPSAIPAYAASYVPSSAQSALHKPLKDGGRGTYIGHSVTDGVPPAQPEKPYDDRLRGTLYGHMLHLPELKLPAPEEPSSRELTIVDQSAPTGQALEIYQPDAARAVSKDLARRAAAGIPQEAEAFPRSDRYRSIPVEVESGPHKKVLLRVGLAAASIAAIVGAAVIWLHSTTEEPELQARPAATMPQAAAPSPLTTTPVGAPAQPPAAGNPPAPVAAVDAPAEPAPVKPARPSTDRPRSVAARPAAQPPAVVAHPEHHHPTAPSPPEAPPKTHSAKHPSVEDDPDGTLAPSIE
ncbi:MAG: hypothetical protein ABUS79_18090 [Pseudomonadota bacterium]